ncbi:2Fe-2S iron-sulfur cluster binding domain-containing protein [Acetobacter senegalensis]|uniref:2Fe-2S iron-sulfur cluster-binding protein n=1 Tax=Acetobacter senegalensis TaxID=446692 RepID=UPI001EDC525A|nr:2Fe-2S iron-sulfur cluster-binding protein [Acetobacter senegalensis]MCG4262432.1 2Fe-2S iron-sulfur cluster binding domain-containing protein [Acetobacter senegalensis]
MPILNVTTRDGAHRALNGTPGHSVMEIIRESGIDEIMALCGGCCSCATCQVYVDNAFIKDLSVPSEDERDLLESSDHYKSNSRLSCQIIFSKALDGLCVVIAPED